MKEILMSKRANIFYLEKCRIMVKDGRVVYLTENKDEKLYWNIPIANTTVVLLGIGTSITQSAVRLLVSANVLIGFSGNGGTPLIAANEVEWISGQNEYRPTEYLQDWLSFWFNEEQRLKVAKYFQIARIDYLQKIWAKNPRLRENNIYLDDLELSSAIKYFTSAVDLAKNVTELLSAEAVLTKKLYKIIATKTNYTNFTRDRESDDLANIFLNHGNYLVYGLAATTLWTLGIPHGFAVMHGKTRRGALVFDVADLVKDAIILPLAFICAKENMSSDHFRQQSLLDFVKYEVLDFMFNSVKIAAKQGNLS